MSTVLAADAGIVRPDGGQVLLRGRRREAAGAPAAGWERIDTLGENRLSALRRSRFGFVFQFGQSLPELPAEENVALPLMLEGVPRRKAAPRPAAAEPLTDRELDVVRLAPWAGRTRRSPPGCTSRCRR